MTVFVRRAMWWWCCVVVLVTMEGGSACPLGGSITGKVECSAADSPYTVTQDVTILPSATLILRPGVTVQLDPGVGIIVMGTLDAQGTELQRITLTSSQPPVALTPAPTLRLVDGPTPMQGRLQIFYKDGWRSICTNSRNWTTADMGVACRQLGFSGGKYWEWQDRANNDTGTLLYQAPSCSGLEDDITKCAWETHAMGGGVCDMHPDLGLDCDPYHALWRGTNHWRGILFQDAEYEGQLFHSTLYQKVSKSVLSYVDIEFAGMGPQREVVSAIMTRRVPPRLRHVTVTNSAFSGINMTLPDTFVRLEHTTLKNNAGHGLYINTSTGSVLVDHNSEVTDNQADGIKYNFHHREPDKSASDTFQDFCAGASNLNQAYPVVTVATQDRHSFNDLNCEKLFVIRDTAFVFTVHFSYMQAEEFNAGMVEVRNRDKNGQVLTRFDLRNNTFPPSVVSRGNSIWIKVTAKPRQLSFIFMEVVASKYKMFDVSLRDSVVRNNSGHGVAVDYMRSLVHIHRSNLTHNYYGSGLNVRQGAGDVNVTHSTVTHNIGDGVNITYEGGLQNITWSTVAANRLRGVAVWFNESGQDTGIHQETGVAYSTIAGNQDVGLRVGNFCRPSFVNVSSNTFSEGRATALKIESCWQRGSEGRTVQIGQNLFRDNRRLAVKVSPAVNMNLTIEYNEFHDNRRGTVLIYNEDKVELPILPFIGKMFRNNFYGNSGWYVLRLGLSLRGLDQNMRLERNVIKDNMVEELFSSFHSRSRAAAVVCIGSSNVVLFRNLLENPSSHYELASHATDQSSPIIASHNWLGSKFEQEIFRRILDRRDLYNLALVQFHPYLLSNNNVETPVMQEGPESEPEFYDPADSHLIGGEVNGDVTLRDGLYTVTRDIYVHETGTLTIAFGTTLEFAEGMGMMVAGLLRTEGSSSRDVKFTLQGTTEQEEVLERAAYVSGEEDVVALNVTGNVTLTEVHTLNLTREGDGAPSLPVKLMGGRDSLEGRLMVWVDGQWGTVCNHGWNQDAAAIACHQMGLVLNPEDWDLQPSQLPSQGQTNPILMSNIQCDEFDTDLTKCCNDGYWELDNSCSHNDDVGLRCYPGSWAGIRLGMTAHESHMKGVIIEKAGLFDYTTRTFKPALQIDFHHHVIQDVEIRNNLQDGVGVVYNNQYAIANPSARVFLGCTFSGNRRHGITLKQLGVNITASNLHRNDGSGLHFNPFVSRAEQRELAGWLNLQKEKYNKLPGGPKSVKLETNLPQYFITETIRGTDIRATIVVTTSHSNVIGIQVLNPITPESTEQVVIYDYQEVIESEDIARWNLRGDQVTFPTTSSTFAITIDYSSGLFALGDVILLLTAVDRRDIAQAGDLRNFRAKWPLTYIDDTRIHNNDIGISTLHYNRYLTDDGDHLLRCANESLMVVNSKIINNQNQAVYALSPFRVRMDNDDMAEITFMFNSTTISGNGRGIDQYSWDVRESNNLFHWVLEDVLVENNGGGGMVLALPYVWQYTENFTHTLYVNSSSFLNNAQFQFAVDGHFARINITHSRFERNVCQRGLLSVQGMEKEMFIHDNQILSNRGSFMVEFNTNSQSGILGSVSAYFEYNRVQNNQPASLSRSSSSWSHQPTSYTMAVRGLQKVNITHNLLGYNSMDYELLAGIFTSRVNNYLNAEANWWGTRRAQEIEQLIFDFDDWNNFALADYLPYLTEDSISGRVSSVGSSAAQETTDLSVPLGGRLLHDLRLPRQPEPYLVKADLTVMPGVTLVVEGGTTLEFFPSVGLLVLGRLEAVGTKDKRITMRPVDPSRARAVQQRARRHVKTTLEAVRLCVEGECGARREGFLDIYNGTTKQWVPICDDRFTERNAEVVCRQLGYNTVNIFHSRNKRTEMFPNALIRIRSWPDPIQCDGTEAVLSECSLRMNGQIFDHTYDCPWNEDFVYISCGDLNLEDPKTDYWGGIRFSIPNFEHMDVYNRIHDSDAPHHAHAHPLVHGEPHTPVYPSLLEWVNVIGAGILHNDKSPAILSFHETPHLRGVDVRDSAYDGLSLISATYGFEMLYNRFENNLGVGVSLLGLTGETRETEESSFFPLSNVRLPYHTFGMVDMCDSTKELRIEERVLLYYKYDNRPVDCVKIFSSVFNVKNFGFRLLHLNLYDSTFAGETIVHDRLVLYDGDIYNYTTHAFAVISARSDNHMRFFKTAGTSLSVELHATGASGDLGFVAEVVTLPISDLGINRNILHNFTYNEYYNNVEGAVFAATAGEVNPWLCFAYSRIEHNGKQLYGNFTTTRAAVHLDVQNMQDVYFKNNLVRNNTGGLYIVAGSIGAATKLQANVTNNLFVGTKHWPALYMASRKDTAYQHALIAYNDFSWSFSPYHDIITLAQVVSVFTHNYAHSNIGRHILDIYGFQKVRLPVYQTTSHNSLAKNVARDPTYQGTIIAGSAGQQFVDNVFYNWDNAYELVAVNESVRCNVSTECKDTPDYTLERTVADERSDVWKTPIDARNNWWGFNTSVAVSGRIHDKTDDETLLHVDYSNWKLNNHSLLHGCEPGYTLIAGSCYLYIGAPVTHAEAKEFCRKDNASLPFLQKGYWEVQHWLLEQQPEYLWESDMVWVQHLDVISGCAAFVYRQVRSVDCNLKLPFICESDADETIDRLAWASDPLAVAAIAMTLGCLILVAACVSCWACKSRERRKERILRRNSIRASIRSNRSAISTSTTTGGFSDLTRRRIIEDPEHAIPMKGQEAVGGAARMNGLSGSFDSIAKSGLNSSLDEDPNYVVYEETTPSIPPGYTSHLDDRFSGDPQLENQNVNELLRPSFNTTFQNHGFRDNSAFSSRENSTFMPQAASEPWHADDQPPSFGQHSFTSYGHSPRLIPLQQQLPARPLPPPPSTNYFPGESGASSLRPEESSLRGSNIQLAGSSITTDSTLEMKKEAEDPHMVATLPRDQAPPYQYMSAGVLPSRHSSSASDDSAQGYFSGRSQSQPLETAM